MDILVIYGGVSSERSSSIKTSRDVVDALKRNGYSVCTYDFMGDGYRLYEAINKIKPTIIYNALHGGVGENGAMQGFLDILGVPYIGSGVLGNALALNKFVTKMILKAAGVAVPKGILVKKNNADIIQLLLQEKIDFPLIVKPNSQGSKLGVLLVREDKELIGAMNNAFAFDDEIIVEEYIDGQEYAASVIKIGEEFIKLPLIHIEHKDNNNNNFMVNKKSSFLLSELGQKSEARINNTLIEIFELFNMSLYARVDLIVKNEQEYILEVSSLPGMSRKSVLPYAAKCMGIEYNELIELFFKK